MPKLHERTVNGLSVERSDDEWIALAALAGAEFFCGDNGRWYVKGVLHPIGTSRLDGDGLYFPYRSHADIARAYCEWLEREAHR